MASQTVLAFASQIDDNASIKVITKAKRHVLLKNNMPNSQKGIIKKSADAKRFLWASVA
jgi:hypothetical protein